MTLLPSFLRRKPDYAALLGSALFLDCETAGLDPMLNGVLSVGAVTADGAHEWSGECRVYSFQKVEKAALKVNGFTMEEAQDPDKQSAHAMVWDLVQWARKVLPPNPTSQTFHPPIGYIVGQNPRWDYEMLRTPWDSVYLKDGPSPQPFPLSHRNIDLHSLTCAAFIKEGRSIPPGGIGSKDIQEYLGLPAEAMPHRALEGAKYHRAMCLALLAKLS